MTTRRGFLRMFAAAPIAGVAVGMAAKADAERPQADVAKLLALPALPNTAHTHWNGAHTHPLTIGVAAGHTHSIHQRLWNGEENLAHVHSFSGADGRIWIL